jgi:hypothetical protein
MHWLAWLSTTLLAASRTRGNLDAHLRRRGGQNVLILENGGERGIRTLGGGFPPHSLSRRAPSAGSAISPVLLNRRIVDSFIRHPSPEWPAPRYIDTACTDLTNRPFNDLTNMAEGVGFEPTELSLNGFQDRRLQPLGHPSCKANSLLTSRTLKGQASLYRAGNPLKLTNPPHADGWVQ